MIDRILALTAPHSCCGCGEIGSEICEGCKYDIISDTFISCIGCLRPTTRGNLCGSCVDFQADTVWCVGERSATLRVLLDSYKFDMMRSASGPLAELLDAVIPRLTPMTVVTWVPSVRSHVRERGFDHMERISREFAARRGLSFSPLLERKKSGTQRFKTKQERQAAVLDAFAVSRAEIPKEVLLIDDILTTGATLRAALELLRIAGVSSLNGAIIARQPLDDRLDLW